MKARDRVKELRRVKARDLLPHPKNWRTHSRHQQDVWRGLLNELGMAGALLVRETRNGRRRVRLSAEVPIQQLQPPVRRLAHQERARHAQLVQQPPPNVLLVA